MFIIVGFIGGVVAAAYGADGGMCLIWMFISAGSYIVLKFINYITSSPTNKTDRLGITDRYLFDKGMTYSNGHEYERYVAYVLERQGYRDVTITPKTGDFGADIICTDSNGRRIAVQCKMYAKPVGYRAVEEALGAMHYYNCDGAMVVTNNTYTKQAETAARKVGVKLMGEVR